MRVAYYYHQPRFPPDHPETNPYGPLLAAALERRGLTVAFSEQLDGPFVRDQQGRIDLLHLNWPHFHYYDDHPARMTARLHAFINTLELARQLGYKIVWTAHNLYPHNRRHQSIDHQGRLALCRLATAVIAHCEAAATAVRDHFGRTDRLFIIPHGHFIDVYRGGPTRAQARAELGVPMDAFCYGFFGSIQPYKGVERLLASFRQLPGERAWLLISGGGQADYLAALHRAVGGDQRIVLRTYPRAPSEDIGLIMGAADVIVLPFLATTTSGTLVLALSSGRPVIAPALGCVPMTVTPAAGILYDPAAADGLERAMLAIQRRDLAAAGQAALAAIARFDWEMIGDLTVEAYQA